MPSSWGIRGGHPRVLPTTLGIKYEVFTAPIRLHLLWPPSFLSLASHLDILTFPQKEASSNFRYFTSGLLLSQTFCGLPYFFHASVQSWLFAEPIWNRNSPIQPVQFLSPHLVVFFCLAFVTTWHLIHVSAYICIALCPSTRSLLTEGVNFVLFAVLSPAPGIVFNTFRDSIFVVWIIGCVFVPLESFWNGNFIPEHKTDEKLFLYYFCFKFYFN